VRDRIQFSYGTPSWSLTFPLSIFASPEKPYRPVVTDLLDPSRLNVRQTSRRPIYYDRTLFRRSTSISSFAHFWRRLNATVIDTTVHWHTRHGRASTFEIIDYDRRRQNVRNIRTAESIVDRLTPYRRGTLAIFR